MAYFPARQVLNSRHHTSYHMNKQTWFTILLAGMSLGTAWAIRGQFGHEQGAAWAGGIGGLGIVMLSKRADWYAKAFHLALASAMGWGIGGIISYGIVVGYGRGLEFGNVYYGFLMLFLIGALFGLIGGGLFGLTLASSRERPVNWPQLIVEMTIGGIIFYYLLIEEFGWLMTPPRSEAWAACVGMCMALYWHIIRHKQWNVIRVSIFAGLGGGFGFAFGNFLQVMGHVSGVKFNFWNVMEYSIGFFGGIGMAYGTFTARWEPSETDTCKQKTIVPLTLLALIIPFVVWDQSFDTQRLIDIVIYVDPKANALAIAEKVKLISLLLVPIFACTIFYYFLIDNKKAPSLQQKHIKQFYFSYLGLYTLFSILITFAFLSLYRIEQYLYTANILTIGFLSNKFQPSFTEKGLNINRWAINFLFILAFFAILTALAINSHGELKGARGRF
jgi:hypothetical protein